MSSQRKTDEPYFGSFKSYYDCTSRILSQNLAPEIDEPNIGPNIGKPDTSKGAFHGNFCHTHDILGWGGVWWKSVTKK